MKTEMREHVAAVREELGWLLDALPVDDMSSLARRVVAANRVFAAGAGRSGLAARAFAMRALHLGKASFVVGDTGTPAIGESDVLVVVSGSGDIDSMVMVAEKAKRAGAVVCIVSGAVDSPLVSIAETAVIIPPAPSGKPVQPMGSRFEQGALLALDCVVLELMRLLGQDEAAMFGRHANLE